MKRPAGCLPCRVPASSWKTSSALVCATEAVHVSTFRSGGRFGLSVSDDASVAVGDSSAGNVDQIGRKAGRGLRWSLVGNLVTKGGSFALGLVLARLLVPADFGVYAVAIAVMGFAMYVN